MVRFLLAAVVFVIFSAGINAQSEDCSKSCSKDKADVTKVSKHCDVPETVSKEGVNTEQVAGAMVSDDSKKEVVVLKKDDKVASNKEVSKDEKGCCTTDKTKTDDPKK